MYRIKWNDFWYCGYDVERGSLWGLDPERCMWIEDHMINYHTQVLNKLEDIPNKELEIIKIM